MNSLRKAALFLALVSLALLFAWLPGTTSAQENQGDGLQNSLVLELQELTEGKVRISTHAKTGMVRFIGTELSNSIPQPAALKASAGPEDVARGFLSKYGELFGLVNQSSELNAMRGKTAKGGRSSVHFQQVYEGIPIMGGELIVQVGTTKNSIISASGEILPDISLDTTPTVAASSAQEAALNVVVKGYGIDPGALRVSEPELWIYNPIILGMNHDFTTLVWQMEVESVELLPVRELVLVDAHLGAIALHFNQIDTAKDREVYDTACSNTLPGTPVRSEGESPTGDTEQDNAYDYSGDTYDFYWSEHGRDSIDDAGMTIISTVDYDPDGGCDYPNAFWNGSQMVYGTGWASADDVVAHELTHGVTDYESNLYYYMQSGAINEAFSDIWGEFVDLTNGAGTDTPAVRWLIGEDLPAGAIRDMSDPTVFDDPDRMTSSYYYCGEADNGGVHWNSGVANKAAYLMVDGTTGEPGGIFNGYTITGMGISKTADVWYEVQTNLFTSASNYADLYDSLQQAAINLGYSPADKQTVKDAIDATEMDQQPTSCPATEVPVCDTGTPNNLWFDDLENTGSGNWASAAIQGSDEWYYPQIPNPYWDTTYATSGVYNLWGLDQPFTADYYIAMTSDVSLPSGAYLHFKHAYRFELGAFDGGVLEYSTDEGSTWNDAGSLFTHNGYNGTIFSGWENPLGGRNGFVNYSDGYISSRLDLSSLAGENIRFRFRIGTDSSVWYYGWFIDDIRIYTCETVIPIMGTWPADNVTTDSARLRGKLVDPGTASSVEVSYEWGTTLAYGNETTPQNMTETGAFFFNLGSLTPGETYHYRAKGAGDGTGYGPDREFTTGTPVMRTWPAFNLDTDSVRLRGKLLDLGLASSADVSFEWGTTFAYGNEVFIETKTTPGRFQYDLDGLTPGVTYHYRSKGVGSGVGTGYGPDRTFTAGVPVMITWRPDNVTDTSARLRGKLLDLCTEPSADVSYQWGTTPAYGNETSAQTMTAPGAFPFNLGSLSPGTKYYYRTKGVSTVGTGYGPRKIFTTPPPP